MKRKLVSILALGILVGGAVCLPGYRSITTSIHQAADTAVVVVDPGHGGIDGGAESSSGVIEKDVNLSISLLLKEKLEEQEIQVVMTRDTDRGLYDEGEEGAIRTLKTQDMKTRKKIIDEAGARLAVSVHLNSFTEDTSVKGAQVFFPSYGEKTLVADSKAAAKIIQAALNDGINTEKARTELGKSDVFLLRNITCPIVIVECGFLSNPEDAENLVTEAYQEKLAAILNTSICKYLSETDQ